jgi:hypothetical protein
MAVFRTGDEQGVRPANGGFKRSDSLWITQCLDIGIVPWTPTTQAQYTDASTGYSPGGILGASLTPMRLSSC